jgi:CBS domain-containing protein
VNRISSYMSTPVICTSPDTLGHEAMVTMLEHEINALLVEENGEYVGVFTQVDWDRKIVRGDGNINSERVGSVMSKNIITIEKSEPLSKAGLLMEEHSIRHLAVTDKGKIIGMLSAKDLERHYRQLQKNE